MLHPLAVQLQNNTCKNLPGQGSSADAVNRRWEAQQHSRTAQLLFHEWSEVEMTGGEGAHSRELESSWASTAVEMYVGRKSYPKIAQLLLCWHAEGRGEKNTIWLSPTGAMGLTNLVQHFSYKWQKRNSIADSRVCPKRESHPRHWSICHSKMFLQHCSNPQSFQNPSNKYCCLFWYYCNSGQILHTTEPQPLCLGLQ